MPRELKPTESGLVLYRWYFFAMQDSSRSIGMVLVAGMAILSWSLCRAQAGNDGTATIRVDTSLVLVDVMAENAKTIMHTRALLTDLQREDFRVFDNGHEMPISSFDIGMRFTTRPIALWLIVQCNEPLSDDWHSAFMRGKTQMLRSAFDHLTTEDAVGVAHWCDDGTAVIDLQPGHNPDGALDKVEEVLGRKPILGSNRPGELAMQKMVRWF